MDRVVDLAGAVNFRDFGGYATADGARVRRGVLFRCGHLAGLTDAGRAHFAGLNIRVVCDLRRPDERQADPSAVPHVTRRVEIPIDPASASMLRDSLADGRLDVEQRVRFMRTITAELTRSHGHAYALMFRALEQHAPGGFLVHCTAGKDRTGVGAALILLALGVPREVVMEDYLLTNEVIDFENFLLPRLRASLGSDEVDLAAARILSGVRREYLDAAFLEMERSCGSVDAYLEKSLGLDPPRRAELREHFLE